MTANFRESTQEMVEYLLHDEATKDKEIVEGYVETFIFGAMDFAREAFEAARQKDVYLPTGRERPRYKNFEEWMTSKNKFLNG